MRGNRIMWKKEKSPDPAAPESEVDFKNISNVCYLLTNNYEAGILNEFIDSGDWKILVASSLILA